MFKAMLRKEFVEIRPVMFLAISALGFLVLLDVIAASVLTPPPSPAYNGFYDEPGFFHLSWMIFLVYALLLGFVQTLADSFQGTWGYLAHLPPGGRWIVSAKLRIGLAAFLCPCVVFIVWWTAVASARQTVVHPFAWPDVLAFAQMTLIGLLVYLGAFLSGLRPARWFGTRLLPLAGCGMLVWVFMGLPQWWVYGVLPLIVLCGLLTALILHVGKTRDFA